MHDTRGMHPIKVALSQRWPPMSQAQLAIKLQMNPSVLSRYLRGSGEPPDGFYIAAAEILGCEPSDLRPRTPAAA